MTNSNFKVSLDNDTLTFPHWSTVAKTYPEACRFIIKKVQETRPAYVYSWLEDRLDNITETDRKREFMARATKDGVVTIQVQAGEKYKGKSILQARETFGENEFGLGLYECACLLLAKPDLLTKWEDLGLDCAGDFLNGADFDYSACLGFRGDGVGFGGGRLGSPGGGFGSASGFVPQLKIEGRNLEAFGSLNSAPKLRKETSRQALTRIADALEVISKK